MVKYSLLFLVVFICVTLAMSAPAPPEEVVAIENDVEDIQPQETKKAKRGIYSGLGHGYGYGLGYGYGHYPEYTYSLAPIYSSYGYGGYGHGHGYEHYPYYSLGYHGYGHGGHSGYYW